MNAISYAELDILFLAETWFIDHESHAAHPMFFVSTPRILPVPAFGQEQAGIVCLVTQGIRKQIFSACLSRYTVNIKINGHEIMAVYFSPSLKTDKIAEHIPDTHLSILIGDINAFFGVQYGAKKIRPLARCNLFRNICSEKSLNHMFPDPLGPTPDHAFVHSSLVASYSFENYCHGLSDHKFMLLRLDIKINYTLNINSDDFKFNLKPLLIQA
ncbi:hypothetical protein AYI70_g9237 [Smittium culicis]|uniref:Endonuclease/exonuclease/phosphatase domain-containing protein n=1 Tax=Smittium culicis TaxID=133412 RepID=A0A1R1XCB8_9FUNG|nr:hypothetical protein AYI70_g9237 [Smittium culicis]